jgi:hypothetical protein
MRDSWIDKEEFEELVGSFTNPKKGSLRRIATSPREKASSADPATAIPAPCIESGATPSPATAPQNEAPPGALSGDLPAQITIPDGVTDSPLLVTEEPVKASVEMIFSEMALETVAGPESGVELVAKGEVDLPPLNMSEFPVTAENRGNQTSDESGATALLHPLFGIDDLEPTVECIKGDEEVIEAMTFRGNDKDGAPRFLESERVFNAPAFHEAPNLETVENLVVADPPNEAAILQRVPLFLDDDSDSKEWRVQSVSQRDADRALIALAEARTKVDQSQLMSRPPVFAARPIEVAQTVIPADMGIPIEVVTHSEPEPEPEPQPESAHSFPAIFEWESESLIPGQEDEVPELELEPQFIFEPSGALHERIARYGECAMRELSARELAVCDRDGLLLYRSPATFGEGSLEAALLVAVSDKVTRLLGFEGVTATQVTDGKGGWRCLLAGASKDVFAGFSLDDPLDYDEVTTWTKALAEAVNPAHRSH